MRTILLILIITQISCQTKKISNDFQNNDTAWKSDNLIGKVKELKMYKSDIETADEMTINFKKSYSDEGYLVNHTKYDTFGNIESVFSQKIINDSTIQNDFRTSEGFINTTTSILDSLKRPKKSVTSFGDTIEITAFFSYNNRGNIASILAIQNEDTTINTYDYKYSTKNKIILENHTLKDDYSVQKFTNTYKYDNKENLIEEIETVIVKYFDDHGNIDSLLSATVQPKIKTTKFKYNNNHIESTSVYVGNEMDNKTIFDSKGNPVIKTFYFNGQMIREFKNKYKFDKNKNWIKKTVYIKEQTSNFALLHIERREIEYYKE